MATGVGSLRDQLLDHAVRLLQEGAEEPSIRALARAAGVSAMAPYRHFPDKGALLGGVADRGFAMLADVLAKADGTGDDAERLVAQGIAYVAFAQAHPALFRLMFARRCAPAATIPAEEPAFAILSHRVAMLAGDRAAEATLGCWSIVHGLATLALDGVVAVTPAQARAVLTLHVAGIVTPPT